jgi:hypothetical protein
MLRLHRLCVLAVAIAAAAAAAAPARADDPTFCPSPVLLQLPDGSVEFGTDANGAGCVVVRVPAGGGITLREVVLAPGWTDEVKSAGGTKSGSRVEVRFTERTTGRRVEVRIEPGRTEIKG